MQDPHVGQVLLYREVYGRTGTWHTAVVVMVVMLTIPEAIWRPKLSMSSGLRVAVEYSFLNSEGIFSRRGLGTAPGTSAQKRCMEIIIDKIVL